VAGPCACRGGGLIFSEAIPNRAARKRRLGRKRIARSVQINKIYAWFGLRNLRQFPRGKFMRWNPVGEGAFAVSPKLA
jgi:hypothetical protein